jgi:hypothetical protein
MEKRKKRRKNEVRKQERGERNTKRKAVDEKSTRGTEN